MAVAAAAPVARNAGAPGRSLCGDNF